MIHHASNLHVLCSLNYTHSATLLQTIQNTNVQTTIKLDTSQFTSPVDELTVTLTPSSPNKLATIKAIEISPCLEEGTTSNILMVLYKCLFEK